MRKRDGMSDTSLVDPGSEKRIDEVADALQKHGGSATSADVAADLGIHPSTARFHLDRLVEQGRVETTRQHRTTRGRFDTAPSSTWPSVTRRWSVPCTAGSSRV